MEKNPQLRPYILLFILLLVRTGSIKPVIPRSIDDLVHMGVDLFLLLILYIFYALILYILSKLKNKKVAVLTLFLTYGLLTVFLYIAYGMFPYASTNMSGYVFNLLFDISIYLLILYLFYWKKKEN